MRITTILAGAVLTAFTLASQAAVMGLNVEDITPIGDPQQMSTADPLDTGQFDTFLRFGAGNSVSFHYFGNNTGGPFPEGTTRIDFETGEDGILNSFSISDGDPTVALGAPATVVLNGNYAGGALFIGDNDNPVIKLIGFVVGDGGAFGGSGSPVGIILNFPDAPNFSGGFDNADGMANVFTLGALPAQVPESGTVALLLVGGAALLAAAGSRRRRRDLGQAKAHPHAGD